MNGPDGESRLVLISGRDPIRTSGGSESYLMGHARAARLAGYHPHSFTITPRSEVLETDYGTLHRVFSPVRPPRSITSVLQRPWLVRAVCDYLRGLRGPHLIHAYGAWADIALAVSLRCKRVGVTAIPLATVFMAIEHETAAKLGSVIVGQSLRWRLVHRLELEWVRHVTTCVERRAFRRMPVVVVNYESVRRELDQRYGAGIPIRRLTYCPPTAFDDPPPPAELPEPLRGFGDRAAPLIVCVSRHDGRKGTDVLIEALVQMRSAGVPFRACLVGPGLLLATHRRWIRQLGLDDQVLVPGRVPEVTPYLQASDVYVLPSRQEGSGSVALLEALQTGAAIVASGIDGIPEDITDGVDGVLIPPGDPAALAHALTQLLDDPARRERLGREARATYERRFAGPVMARQLKDLYEELGLPARQP
ncbi:MAG: glycosyltransferase family 4 protein [Solirubrobacteraceae bacterium]